MKSFERLYRGLLSEKTKKRSEKAILFGWLMLQIHNLFEKKLQEEGQ